jgi:polar amino acid transport system substrate-binding protein
VAKSASIAAALPAGVVKAGTLSIGTDPVSPPNAFVAPGGSAVVGMDVDLGTAIGQVLGLRTTFVTTPQASVVSGVTTGQLDLGMSSITDTPAARGKVDFVDYFQSGQGFFVKAGSGRTFASLTALCGSSVAVGRGTPEQAALVAQAGACARGGMPTLRVVPVAGLAAAVGTVAAGTVDAGFATSQGVDFAVAQSHGRLAVGGQPINVAPLGIVASPSVGLAQPVASALNTLITDGTYAAILAKWGVQSGAVTTATINGGR